MKVIMRVRTDIQNILKIIKMMILFLKLIPEGLNKSSFKRMILREAI
jgi:hypothetical protein